MICDFGQRVIVVGQSNRRNTNKPYHSLGGGYVERRLFAAIVRWLIHLEERRGQKKLRSPDGDPSGRATSLRTMDYCDLSDNRSYAFVQKGRRESN